MPFLKGFQFDNSYARELEGLYVKWGGQKVADPSIVQLNDELALELGLNPQFLKSKDGAQFLVGRELPESSISLAQAYAGHQFGGFAPSLGDGRALLIGEIIDTHKNRRDVYLKGSGRTPFSRGGDGNAAIGPVLREYLVSEAMHAMGVPTTRALAAITTGNKVRRDGLEPGAVLTRVASSHLRVGTFQYFAARKEDEKVKRLADYAIARHYPELANTDNKYLGLLQAVIDRQCALVAKWVSLGFVHGVMNTDNTTISGETIDYGPCAFMDYYDPQACYSSIDRYGRYCYSNQPLALQWNLARFAETILPLIDEEDKGNSYRLAGDEMDKIKPQYEAYWLAEMSVKLGLPLTQSSDKSLIENLFKILEDEKVDFTQLFRRLADVLRSDKKPVKALFIDQTKIDSWLVEWIERLKGQDLHVIAEKMNTINPAYIPRNHLVEAAVQAATKELDFEPFEQLLNVVTNPFEQREQWHRFEQPAPPSFGQYTTFCGT